MTKIAKKIVRFAWEIDSAEVEVLEVNACEMLQRTNA